MARARGKPFQRGHDPRRNDAGGKPPNLLAKLVKARASGEGMQVIAEIAYLLLLTFQINTGPVKRMKVVPIDLSPDSLPPPRGISVSEWLSVAQACGLLPKAASDELPEELKVEIVKRITAAS